MSDVQLYDIPPINTVASPADELVAADALAKTELILRRIESARLEVTRPLNDALSARNSEAKQSAEPWEKMKECIAEKLSAWRSTDEFQKLLANRDKQERLLAKLMAVATEDDIPEMNKLGIAVKEALAVAPKSVSTTVPAVVRYRSKVVVGEVDEIVLPECYFKKVVDEKAIAKDFEAGIIIPGVAPKRIMSPYVVEE